MAAKTMGEIISRLRKEKEMTQAELAAKLNITDKAVSKWERDLSCPDISTIPKLAEILGISVEELLNVKSRESMGTRVDEIVGLVLKVIPLALGVAVVALGIMEQLDPYYACILLGMGMACLGVDALRGVRK